MPSFKAVAITAAAALLASVQADYEIKPESVSLTNRQFWCSSELSTCPIICAQTTEDRPLTNTCDPYTLTYGCVCSDGQQPNVTQYSLTLPYFVCTEWGTQCVKDCGQANNDCADACRKDHPCGAQDPVRVTTTAAAPKASATEDPDKVYSGFGSSDSSSSSSSKSESDKVDKNAAPALGAERVGFMVVMGTIVAGAAVLL